MVEPSGQGESPGLRVGRYSLTGVIPSELEDLGNLVNLYLDGNSFAGFLQSGLRSTTNRAIVLLALTGFK